VRHVQHDAANLLCTPRLRSNVVANSSSNCSFGPFVADTVAVADRYGRSSVIVWHRKRSFFISSIRSPRNHGDVTYSHIVSIMSPRGGGAEWQWQVCLQSVTQSCSLSSRRRLRRYSVTAMFHYASFICMNTHTSHHWHQPRARHFPPLSALSFKSSSEVWMGSTLRSHRRYGQRPTTKGLWWAIYIITRYPPAVENIGDW